MRPPTLADKVAGPPRAAMNPMRTRRPATIQDLRLAVDYLPRDTRIAMLEGIRANEVIVGAYTTDDGVCPMLAAHRAGERKSSISFARAWDRFAFRNGRDRRPRRATERELLVLITHLEASLLEDEGPAGLSEALAEHRELIEHRRAQSERPRPGDGGRHSPVRRRRSRCSPQRKRPLHERSGPELAAS